MMANCPAATVSTTAVLASGITARWIGATSNSRMMPQSRSNIVVSPANIAENGKMNTTWPSDT